MRIRIVAAFTGEAFSGNPAGVCVLEAWPDEPWRLGRDRLAGYQASARGGYVRTHVRGDRVELSGRAVTVLDGELLA